MMPRPEESMSDTVLAVSEDIQMTPLGSTHDLVTKDDYKIDANVGDETVNDNANRAQALPPVDGGKAAWFFLASCYLLEVGASDPRIIPKFD
jgi:hypothetical protein